MIDAVLARIGLDHRAGADVDGPARLHRAYLEHVPYEDLAVQLGETGPLDEAALAARVPPTAAAATASSSTRCSPRYCGRAASRSPTTGRRGRRGADEPHGPARAIDGERWIADAGLGEGFLEPLPLREGRYASGRSRTGSSREPDGNWWMGQHEWSSFSGFRMAGRNLWWLTSSPTIAGSPPTRVQIRPDARRPEAGCGPHRDVSFADPLRGRACGEQEARVVDRDEFAAIASTCSGSHWAGPGSRAVEAAVSQHEAFVASG